MSKVIIAIHGLGNKPPATQLKEWGRMAIIEGIEREGLDMDLPEFELVYWADILYDRPQTLDEKDTKSVYYLDEVYTKAPKYFKAETPGLRLHFQEYLKKLLYGIFLKKDYRLRYSFLSQKLLHNYFRELEVYFTENCQQNADMNCKSKEQIINRLLNVLDKHKNDDIMLVAHSMGSIVAFDVLSFIAKESCINTFVTMGSPLGMPFVVSKIASHTTASFNGHIQLRTPETVCYNWYNFSDITDLIALDYKLSDDFEPNSKGVKVIDQLVKNDYAMNGVVNPHKSYGYLRAPEFIHVLKEFTEN